MCALPHLPVESALPIGTRRLLLSPLVRDDAEGLFPVLSDPALYAFTGDAPPESEDDLRRLFAFREGRRSPDGAALWLNWGVRARRRPDALVGYVQATVEEAGADVAWVIGSAWQGRGYASEAAAALVAWLERLGVRSVRAAIHPDHRASQRVAARSGLRRTAERIDGEEVWRSER